MDDVAGGARLNGTGPLFVLPLSAVFARERTTPLGALLAGRLLWPR